jgi:hypothetical protein
MGAGRFVEDVSVPDRTVMTPNEPFTKSWRFRNESSESWPPHVELTFVGPTDLDRMGSPAVVPIESCACASGEEIVVSVALVAPASKGRYTGYWRLQESGGAKFGMRVWVSIDVTDTRSDGSHHGSHEPPAVPIP